MPCYLGLFCARSDGTFKDRFGPDMKPTPSIAHPRLSTVISFQSDDSGLWDLEHA